MMTFYAFISHWDQNFLRNTVNNYLTVIESDGGKIISLTTHIYNNTWSSNKTHYAVSITYSAHQQHIVLYPVKCQHYDCNEIVEWEQSPYSKKNHICESHKTEKP